MQAGTLPDQETPQGYTGGPPAGGPSGPRAGFWQRFGGAFIDGLLVGIVIQGIAALVGSAAIAVLLYLAGIAYYVILEGGPTGQTLGKRAMGIRVISIDDGRPIGYGRAAIRYFGRIISSIVIFLGYFWMIWDGEKQTWHDKFASSVVVPVSDYPV